jgi:hypothetical protein
MLRFLFPSRPAARPAHPRTRLRVEWLETRFQPSGTQEQLPQAPPAGGQPAAAAGNQAPTIENFTFTNLGNGLFCIHGFVRDEQPGGLTVRFEGPPALDGKTVTTTPTGYFEITVQLQCNGTDSGTLTAVATDAQGATGEAEVWLNPTASQSSDQAVHGSAGVS